MGVRKKKANTTIKAATPVTSESLRAASATHSKRLNNGSSSAVYSRCLMKSGNVPGSRELGLPRLRHTSG